MDWIDEEKARRDRGIKRPLSGEAHQAVNQRYPGTTLELCRECDQPTGRAGRAEDSLYRNGIGPYCESCCPEEAEED